MKVEYYRQGAARKELVQAISDITCTKAKYLFLPTRATRSAAFGWRNSEPWNVKTPTFSKRW